MIHYIYSRIFQENTETRNTCSGVVFRPSSVPTGIFKISYGFPILRNILSFSPLRAST